MNDERPVVLVVEDEPKLAEIEREYLERAGYAAHVLGNGNEVAPWVREHRPALVVLDLMLPGKDGLDVCREVRTFSDVPIVMVTARVDEIDRLLGLEIGADDYVCKPFSPREVVARIRAILRRANARDAGAAAHGFEMDEARYAARVDGRPLDLTPVEFRLLKTLLDSPGRVWSRQQLLDRLYDDHRVVSDRTVDSHVKNLRRKIEAIRPGAEVIRSVYGVGYKLEA
jgi:two-component system, OmpR family, response regulator BaeR